MNAYIVSRKLFAGLMIALPVFLLQGCLATQDWVREQLTPTESRVGKLEGELQQMSTRLSATESRLASAEGRIGQVDAKVDQVSTRLDDVNNKADKALNSISNLRLDRKLLLDLKDGAFYSTNSTVLTAAGKQNIDVFLSDLKSDLAGNDNVLIVVAGFTDNTGSPEYNYELGLLRARGIMKYLTLEKKINPARLTSVSYGATAPVGDNSTSQGRAQNRRVEIRVYKEAITAEDATASAPSAKAPTAPKTLSR